MARILVVEDEAKLALVLQIALQDERHAADVERDGASGLLAAEVTHYDLIILDRMLPRLDGLSVCRRLRAARNQVPVLMLTARDTPSDVIAGLDAGADDYLTKPFALDVLLARIRSLLRRAGGQASTVLSIGPLEFDTVRHRVRREGQEIALTGKELQILEALTRRPGAIVSRDQLAEAAWERDVAPESNAVEVHVAGLRRKLEREPGPKLIHTVRGVGYVMRWEAP